MTTQNSMAPALSASPAAPPRASLAKNLIGTSAANLFQPLVALATAPMLARSLGVNGRGQFAAATVPLMLVTAIATLGMPEATVYLVARLRRDAWRTFRASATVLAAAGAVSTLLLVVLAPTLADGN